MIPVSYARRLFLSFLAGSPLFAKAAWAQQASVLANSKDALSVLDFEEAAHRALPPAHWGYMASGVDDDGTLKINREGFKHYQLRPRRLVDVAKTDLRVEVFGQQWERPIFLCPVGSQRAFHPEGEVAVARAAKTRHSIQILSTVTSAPVEEVGRALGAPPWFQLYMPTRWEATEKLVRRVEAAGCPVLVWTVDLLAGRNLETADRFRKNDTRQCNTCHPTAAGGTPISARAMFQGIEGELGINPLTANWETLDRLKKLTRMKLVVKGIDSREDAALCREHGVDGIVVSNHGGRAMDTGRSTIEALSEVIDAAGPIPVFVDGGFRRGTDIYKALALGARAVGIGRPYVWGLSAFGQEGVERVLDILHAELELTMRQCGTPSVKQISRAVVTRVAS